MSDVTSHAITAAVEDFYRARRRASLREVLGLLRGTPSELLNYDEVRRQLKAVESAAQRLEEIPLDAIVGSVGRYQDFTRDFLPRNDSDQQRWVGVKLAMTGMEGVPPIEVYRLGDAYFVKDGNHRVSVARQLGSRYIQAYVTPVHTRVPLSPDDDPDDLIIKAEYADFLDQTELDRLRPGADLRVTAPGQYQKLLEHIHVHRYYMGIDEDREVGWAEAVAHWYDEVYLPVVRAIRRHGLLRGFEGRTETDLYLWLADHRAALEQAYGWSLTPEAVAGSVSNLAELDAEAQQRVLRRATGKDRVEAAEAAEAAERLAADVLVPVAGTEDGWQALEQALVVAAREGSRLYGLHVVADEEARDSDAARAVEARFLERCAEAGVAAQFAFAVGGVVPSIVERAALVDLVVANLVHPPGAGLTARLSSGYPQLLRRTPRPLLAVPGVVTDLSRPLLAYDGGERAQAALFLAAYAAAAWQVPLTVVTVAEAARTGERILDQARRYLAEHELDATFVRARGNVAEAIVETAEAHDCNAILMGSYSTSRLLETVFGGVLEPVLQRGGRPVLVT